MYTGIHVQSHLNGKKNQSYGPVLHMHHCENIKNLVIEARPYTLAFIFGTSSQVKFFEVKVSPSSIPCMLMFISSPSLQIKIFKVKVQVFICAIAKTWKKFGHERRPCPVSVCRKKILKVEVKAGSLFALTAPHEAATTNTGKYVLIRQCSTCKWRWYNRLFLFY